MTLSARLLGSGVAASSGFSTIRNEPEEWERSSKGFGKRFASSFGKNVIRNTAIYGIDEALKIDSHFYRSKKRDFGSRVGNAICFDIYSTDRKRQTDGRSVTNRRHLHREHHRRRSMVSAALQLERRNEKRHDLARHQLVVQPREGVRI